MTTIAELFESYRKRVIPPSAPEVQIIECRRAFFAASYAMLMFLLNEIGGDTATEDAGVEMLDALRAECEAFGAAGGEVPAMPPDINYTVPDPHDMQARLRSLGDLIGGSLPGGWGFLLMLFEYGEGGSLFYMSSADRADVLAMLREYMKKQTQ